jgi:hypothetical protein
MIWCYLLILPFLWEQLIAGFNPGVRMIVCFMLFFSGLVSLIGGINGQCTGYELATRSELNAVAAAVKPFPAVSTFAAFPTFNHPLLLNGRKIAVGYSGHLWSHGYANFQEEENTLRALMLGGPGWRENARTLDVRYIYWGSREAGEFSGSVEPWKTECRQVAQAEDFNIYDLQSSATNPAPVTTAPAEARPR